MSETARRKKVTALVVILFVPAMLSMIAGLSTQGEDYGILAGMVLVAGSIVAGVLGGLRVSGLLADKLVRAGIGVRWLVGIGAALVCGFLAFSLGVGGCALIF